MLVKEKKKKSTIGYNDYIKGIKYLKPEEQLNIVEIISVYLKKNVNRARTQHSIMGLEGLGANIWKNTDIKNYINKERNSWS